MINRVRNILFGLFILAVLSLPNLCFGQDENLIPIVFEDYPPYEYVDDGEVKGINIDLIREAFKRLGLKPFFEPRPWKRAVYEVQNGDIMALSSGFKTEEREKYVYYSEGAGLGMETNCVVALSVSGVKVETLEDLRGLRIGVVRDYVYGSQFDSIKGLNKIEASSSHQLMRMLLNQRMDVAIGNKAVFRFLARNLGKLAHINFVYEIGSEPLYLMFSRAQGKKAAKLSRDFGAVIREMKKDGTFQSIESKY